MKRNLVISMVTAFLLFGMLGFSMAASLESGSVTASPVTLYTKGSAGDSGTVATAVSGSNPIPTTTTQSGSWNITSIESAGSWATARTNVVANDTATTYGTADTGNFSTSGYKSVRFRIFMNATADSMTFACGSATPVTNPYYGYTPAVTVSGYSTTAPFTCSCDTNGQTVMFPKVNALSSGANITGIKYQLYN